MGVYDTIRIKCPICKSEYFAQTKGGECEMTLYELEDTPPDVLSDANRHAPYDCSKCGSYFEVDIQKRETVLSGC